MKKLIMVILLIFILIPISDTVQSKHYRSIPEKIIDSVMLVNKSSGISIYSDDNITLVLTAYHNVSEIVELFENCADEICNYNFGVISIFTQDSKSPPRNIYFTHNVKNIVYDPHIDLALLEIEEKNSWYSKIKIDPIRLGDDIWIGANPDGILKSLKKGIISSKFTVISGKHYYEISGGVTFGSSGGGVFSADGNLIGIIKSVKILETNQCFNSITEDQQFIEEKCVEIPLGFIGFSSTLEQIQKFILDSKYGYFFDYLKRENL